jgi:hypothetical protein
MSAGSSGRKLLARGEPRAALSSPSPTDNADAGTLPGLTTLPLTLQPLASQPATAPQNEAKNTPPKQKDAPKEQEAKPAHGLLNDDFFGPRPNLNAASAPGQQDKADKRNEGGKRDTDSGNQQASCCRSSWRVHTQWETSMDHAMPAQ